MIIYITEPNETNPQAIELLQQNGHVVIFELKDHKPADIDVLFIRTYTKATKDYLHQFSNIKYILRIGVGLDNVDVEECKRRNITVINSPGSNANAVAEYVVGTMIATLRNFFIQSEEIQGGKWRNKEFIGSEIKNKTIGIVGCGAIGKLIAKKLQNFEVKTILGYDPFLDIEMLKSSSIEKCELDYLLKQSDIITLHLPLNEQTKNLIAYETFKIMKKNVILINSARGGIVNELDLVRALNERLIKAATLDVFENEPGIKKELLHLDNLTATPHIAGFTEEADEEMALTPVRKFIELTQ